ncbi:MAG: oxidoreductase domain protein [Herbinix sp.]|jgi:predicted dehydrogenase|nr:oxidoreductase domain protein [Herbinix sp.]
MNSDQSCNKEKLGFGILGCGNISDTHALAISELEDATLLSVCDIVPEKAMKMAAKYNCSYDLHIDDLLKREDIDVICICTPSGLHSKHGIQAARAKKHLIIEKPIDVSLIAAKELIQVCKEEGVLLCGISQHRFDDDIIRLKEAVSSGKLGQLNFGGSHTKWFRSQNYYDSGDWRGTWELDGGGALMNQSIHYIDLLQYIMGPVDEVFAYCVTRAHENIEVEDIGIATVKFKSGAVGVIEGNTAAFPGYCTRLDIYGTDGSVVIINDKIHDWNLKSEGVTEADFGRATTEEDYTRSGAIKGWASTPGVWHTSHQREIKDMITAIKEGNAPKIPGEEAIKPLEIILAIYESARIGKPVKIPLI